MYLPQFLKKKKDIIIFCDAPPDINSGAGKNAFNLAKAIKKEGQNVKIITFNYLEFKKKVSFKDNIEIIQIPFWGIGPISRRLSIPLVFIGFKTFLLNTKAIIFFGAPTGHRILIFIGKIFKIKTILRSTSLGDDDIHTLVIKFGKIYSLLIKYIYNNLYYYIAINPLFASKYKEVFEKKSNYIILPQGIDVSKFYRISQRKKLLVREKLGLSDSEFIIISVGYLLKRKGYLENFEILSQLKSFKFKYIIIGDFKPKEDNYYKRWSKKRINEMQYVYNYGMKALKDKIKFIGSVDNVNEYLQSSDLFIHNSYIEGTPNVVIEAMATGIPSIVRELPGVNHFLTKNEINCLVVKNKIELKKAILRLINDRNLRNRIGANAAEFIKENFNILYTARKIIELINDE